MDKIIVYGSQYGSAEKYAKELGKRLGFECKRFEEVRDINAYETIVYIGSLYAGGVQGMKKTLKKLSNVENKKITFFLKIDLHLLSTKILVNIVLNNYQIGFLKYLQNYLKLYLIYAL